MKRRTLLKAGAVAIARPAALMAQREVVVTSYAEMQAAARAGVKRMRVVGTIHLPRGVALRRPD